VADVAHGLPVIHELQRAVYLIERQHARPSEDPPALRDHQPGEQPLQRARVRPGPLGHHREALRAGLGAEMPVQLALEQAAHHVRRRAVDEASLPHVEGIRVDPQAQPFDGSARECQHQPAAEHLSHSDDEGRQRRARRAYADDRHRPEPDGAVRRTPPRLQGGLDLLALEPQRRDQVHAHARLLAEDCAALLPVRLGLRRAEGAPCVPCLALGRGDDLRQALQRRRHILRDPRCHADHAIGLQRADQPRAPFDIGQPDRPQLALQVDDVMRVPARAHSDALRRRERVARAVTREEAKRGRLTEPHRLADDRDAVAFAQRRP